MTLDELKNKINVLLDEYAKDKPTVSFVNQATQAEGLPVEKLARTDGKRAIRTKSTGDRVYLIDDNAKTKAWVAGTQSKPGPELLKELGFEMSDVEEVEDSSLLGYQMAPSIYKTD